MFSDKLKTAFKSILGRIGDPLEDGVLYGPLHNQQALDNFQVEFVFILNKSFDRTQKIVLLYQQNNRV